MVDCQCGVKWLVVRVSLTELLFKPHLQVIRANGCKEWVHLVVFVMALGVKGPTSYDVNVLCHSV